MGRKRQLDLSSMFTMTQQGDDSSDGFFVKRNPTPPAPFNSPQTIFVDNDPIDKEISMKTNEKETNEAVSSSLESKLKKSKGRDDDRNPKDRDEKKSKGRDDDRKSAEKVVSKHSAKQIIHQKDCSDVMKSFEALPLRDDQDEETADEYAEDDETVERDANGFEVRSEDEEDDDAASLENFVVGSDEDEESAEDSQTSCSGTSVTTTTTHTGDSDAETDVETDVETEPETQSEKIEQVTFETSKGDTGRKAKKREEVLAEIDTSLIITGARQRRTAERYVDPDLGKLLVGDVLTRSEKKALAEEARALALAQIEAERGGASTEEHAFMTPAAQKRKLDLEAQRLAREKIKKREAEILDEEVFTSEDDYYSENTEDESEDGEWGDESSSSSSCRHRSKKVKRSNAPSPASKSPKQKSRVVLVSSDEE